MERLHQRIEEEIYQRNKLRLDLDQFKADLSKVLFAITERLAKLETKDIISNRMEIDDRIAHSKLLDSLFMTVYAKQDELEAKVKLLDQERLFLEGRIQTLERFTHNLNTLHESHTAEILQNMRDIKTLQDDLTTLEEDTEITQEMNPEDYAQDTYIERAEARKKARD